MDTPCWSFRETRCSQGVINTSDRTNGLASGTTIRMPQLSASKLSCNVVCRAQTQYSSYFSSQSVVVIVLYEVNKTTSLRVGDQLPTIT